MVSYTHVNILQRACPRAGWKPDPELLLLPTYHAFFHRAIHVNAPEEILSAPAPAPRPPLPPVSPGNLVPQPRREERPEHAGNFRAHGHHAKLENKRAAKNEKGAKEAEGGNGGGGGGGEDERAEARA